MAKSQNKKMKTGTRVETYGYGIIRDGITGTIVSEDDGGYLFVADNRPNPERGDGLYWAMRHDLRQIDSKKGVGIYGQEEGYDVYLKLIRDPDGINLVVVNEDGDNVEAPYVAVIDPVSKKIRFTSDSYLHNHMDFENDY